MAKSFYLLGSDAGIGEQRSAHALVNENHLKNPKANIETPELNFSSFDGIRKGAEEV